MLNVELDRYLFPLSTERMLKWVPHRPPMVWVQSVLSVDSAGGECSIDAAKIPHCMGPRGVRRSSFVEFMAQSFAFVRVSQGMVGIGTKVPRIEKAYLVSLKDIEFVEGAAWEAQGERAAQKFVARIYDIREVGPITMFSADVSDADAPRKVYARGHLRVYSV